MKFSGEKNCFHINFLPILRENQECWTQCLQKIVHNKPPSLRLRILAEELSPKVSHHRALSGTFGGTNTNCQIEPFNNLQFSSHFKEFHCLKKNNSMHKCLFELLVNL